MSEADSPVLHIAMIWAGLALFTAGGTLQLWHRRAAKPDPDALGAQGGIDQLLSQIVAIAGAIAAFLALLPFGGLIGGAFAAMVALGAGAVIGALAPRPIADRFIPVLAGLALALGLVAGFAASGAGLAIDAPQ